MGYDAFGLPAENAAIREGGHPREVTERNIAAIRRQMKRMGWSIDWSRELSTHEPEYYRWTQWIFLQLYQRGLAYRRTRRSSGARSIDRARERAGDRRALRALRQPGRGPHARQWYFKITAYADRLLDDMALLEDWPERVLTMQRNWIGRSHGAQVRFHQPELGSTCRSSRRARTPSTARRSSCSRPSIRTSRASWPARSASRRCSTYVRRTAAYSEEERAQDKTKTGVDTGRIVVNPMSGERIPIWVADYVLMGYGTGAIMAVPAHDERDLEFAQTHGLPMRKVVVPRRRRGHATRAPTSRTATTRCSSTPGRTRAWPNDGEAGDRRRARAHGDGKGETRTACATG